MPAKLTACYLPLQAYNKRILCSGYFPFKSVDNCW